MKKLKTLTVIPFLLICVMLFGAWTYEAPEIRYADAPLLSTYADEVVSFTKRDILAEGTTDKYCPYYCQTSDLSNACGAVAGSEIVAFYDKYYPNLIPNWDSFYPANGKYRKQDFTYVPALMRELYTLMRTNVDDVGVSRADFFNGLTSYVNNNGYQINYQDVKSGNTVDYTACKNAIDNNKVIVLFVTATNVYNIQENANYDLLMPTNIGGAHIMVAYGYFQVRYYNASGAFRTDTYLEVAVGQNLLSAAYYNINSASLQGSYIVSIA